MTLEQFITYLRTRGVAYEREGAVIRVVGSLDLRRLTTLPEGVTLHAGGSLDLRRLTTLPVGVTLSAGDSLYLSRLTTLPVGVTLSAGGALYLSRLTALPAGVTLSAGNWLDLGSLTTLPAGATIRAGGALYLSRLTALPVGVTLSAGDSLYLSRLTTLPAGATLSAGGSLYLTSLTTLPAGVTLHAGGALDLSSLTALPAGVTLSAGRWLDLSSLSNETQRYQGKTIRLRYIDGDTMRLIRARKAGAATLWTAQYFRGHLDTDPRCYVAQEGDTYAHGETAEQALRDLRFKIMAASFDPDELVARIKRRGTVEFNDYRLLTGACESGLREGLRARGLDPDTNELPLATALELSRGAYGGDRFARLMAGGA